MWASTLEWNIFSSTHTHTHTNAHACTQTSSEAEQLPCCGTAATVCVWDGATNLRRTAAKVMTLLRVFVWRNETKHGGNEKPPRQHHQSKPSSAGGNWRSALVLLVAGQLRFPVIPPCPVWTTARTNKQNKKNPKPTIRVMGLRLRFFFFLAFTGVSNLLCTKTWLFSFVTWLLTQG